MGELDVDTAGLQSVAAHAEVLAAQLALADTPPIGSNQWQASTAAIGVVSTLASRVAQAFARRMSTTAENLGASSARYDEQDERSASSIETAAL